MMRIGEVAKLSNLPASTLRYYEKIGLIVPVKRRAGQRDYAPEILRTLDLIKLAQSAGYTLAEIRTWLSLIDDRDADWRYAVQTKMNSVRDMIAHYQGVLARLQTIADCPCETPRTCPHF